MEERRGAQRLAVPKPVPSTFGGFETKIVEISVLGCQIQHSDRFAPKAKLPLKFRWRGKEVRIDATVVRSEMRSVGGKPAYMSAIEFCKTPEESPAVIREIVAWLAPKPEEEVESLSADYMQCVLQEGTWTKLYVAEAAQPADGFTIPAPANENEADVLCRAYEKADAAKRSAMRAQFEQAIKQQQRRA